MAHRTVSERNLGKKTLKKFACLGITHEFLSSSDIFFTNFSLFFSKYSFRRNTRMPNSLDPKSGSKLLAKIISRRQN